MVSRGRARDTESVFGESWVRLHKIHEKPNKMLLCGPDPRRSVPAASFGPKVGSLLAGSLQE
jgi:hypothetical protein